MKITEEIKKLGSETSSGTQKAHLSYTSVVREFFEQERANPLAGIVNAIFQTRRKLKPTIKKRTSVRMENVSQATIKVHISSGINIPIRE